eukprot:1711610-Prymnesium_polylepis.1
MASAAGIASLATAVAADLEAAPLLSSPPSQRGFGVELELVTHIPEAAQASGPPDAPLRLLVQQTLDALLASAQVIDLADRAGLAAALDRCRRWAVSKDGDIAPTVDSVARRCVEGLPQGTEDEACTHRRCMALLTCALGTFRSEFKSPPPPFNLRFSAGAATEISSFVHGVLGSIGAAAPSITADGNAGTALHVHVNILNPEAGGESLTAEQITRVILWWVRFDLVTARFARPWCWRERYCAPMYASGAEFGYHETAWDQGLGSSSFLIPPATDGCDRLRRLQYHVPTVVRAWHAAWNAPGFEALNEAEQVARLIDVFGTGRANIGRYCSLNIYSLRRHGTLEFRRFHGTVDARLITRWAHSHWAGPTE